MGVLGSIVHAIGQFLMGSMRAGYPGAAAIVASVAALGCGSASWTPPPEEPEPPEPPIDLAAVRWPTVADPLPEGVPAWVHGFDTTQPDDPRYQPQLSRVSERLFRMEGRAAGDLRATVLLCTVYSSAGAADPHPIFRSQSRSRADLTVVGSVAGGPEFRASAPNNARLLAFSVPVQRLGVGDRVDLRLLDRDILFHDHVGRLSLRYEGTLPFEVEQGPLRASCHAYAPERVADLSGMALRSLDEAIARLMLRLEEPRSEGVLAQPRWRQFRGVREAFDAAAAYTGFVDERLQLRRARIDALADAERLALQVSFDERWEEAAPTNEWATFPSGGRARVVELYVPTARSFTARREPPEVRTEIELPTTGPRAIYWLRLIRPTSVGDKKLPVLRQVDGRSLRIYELSSHEKTALVAPDAGPALLEISTGHSDDSEHVMLRVGPFMPTDQERDAGVETSEET